MNLRTKMVVSFMGIILVPTIALITVSDVMMSSSISGSYAHKGKDSVERIVNYTFAKLVTELKNYVAFVAVDTNFTRAAYYLNEIDSSDDIRKVGVDFKNRLGLSYLEVLNTKNVVTYSTLPKRKGMKVQDDEAINSLQHRHIASPTMGYDPGTGEMLIHAAAEIRFEDKVIGYLHGGYILDEDFLREMAGDETILGVFFYGPGKLRATAPVNLSTEQITAATNALMSQCIPEKNSDRPCKEYGYHIWESIGTSTPFLYVAGLLYIPGNDPVGLVITAEDANVMFREKIETRQTILLFGGAFMLLGATLGWFASGAIVRPVNKLTKDLALIAETDQLTGARNRRTVSNIFKMEISRAARQQSAFAILLFDIDYFKRINDTYGHHIGDEVLKHVVKVGNASFRNSDYCVRYGGEEFLFLLPISYSQPVAAEKLQENDFASAHAAAERLRQALKKQPLVFAGKTIPTTVSIGIAIYPYHGDNHEQLLRRADKALYKAKNSGRDRAVIYETGITGPDDVPSAITGFEK